MSTIYIDPRQQLLDAAQLVIDTHDSDLEESARKALCAALFRCRWGNDHASLKELSDRFSRAKTAAMQKFIDEIASRGKETSQFRPKVYTQVMEDGRIEMRGDSLPPHPDLFETYPNGWSLMDYAEPRDALHYCEVAEHNIVRDYDEKRLTDPHYGRAMWQVIFKIRNDDGVVRDYSRGSFPADDTIRQIEERALSTIRCNGLCGAVIQFW